MIERAAKPASDPLAHVDALAAPTAIVLRLIDSAWEGVGGAADIAALLESEPPLSERVGLAPLASEEQADPDGPLDEWLNGVDVADLRIRLLALKLEECFAESGAGQEFPLQDFWQHALAAACAARRLAAAHEALRESADAISVAALLHDLGKPALAAIYPRAYERILRQAAEARGELTNFERAALGTDHAAVSERVAKNWGLPRDLRELLRIHHVPAASLAGGGPQADAIRILQLADILAREQQLGFSGNHAVQESVAELSAGLDLPTEVVAGVARELPELLAPIASSTPAASATPEAEYEQALTRANTELGRVNMELIAGNRKLAARARYFRALTSFDHSLVAWGDPAAVVAAAARAAQLALQRDSAAAFGVRDSFSSLDVAWVSSERESSGQITQALPPDLLGWLRECREQVGAGLLRAPGALKAIQQLVESQLGPGACWLAPIFQRGTLIGGLVLISDVDEQARLAEETEDLGAFLGSMGLALARANALSAAQRLSDDFAETNRRVQQMQQDALRSRTLSMIAEMAAGAGHELNNPLTVISGRAQMLLDSVTDAGVRRGLEQILEKAHECSRIVSDLMDFARPPAPKLAPVDLSHVLPEVRADWLAQAGLPPSRVQLEADSGALGCASAGPALVITDLHQLRDVLFELLNNAADAVAANSGSLRLACRAAGSESYEITVADSGPGMPPAVLNRAFDPFFSHRDAGRGRGLGLARSARIIEGHGGRIWIDSQPGQGTVVHVVLPAAPGPD